MRGKNCALSRLAGKRGKILFFVRIYDMLYLRRQRRHQALCPQTQEASLTGTWVPAKDDFFLESRSPRMPKGGKGGCTMTFEQVVLLLTLLGGAIYVTFEITWTVSHSDDKKKK